MKNNNNNENDLVPGSEEWWSILNPGSASGCCRRYLRLGCWPTWSTARIEIEINLRYFLSKKYRKFECTYITNIWKQWNEIVLWFGSLKTRVFCKFGVVIEQLPELLFPVFIGVLQKKLFLFKPKFVRNKKI